MSRRSLQAQHVSSVWVEVKRGTTTTKFRAPGVRHEPRLRPTRKAEKWEDGVVTETKPLSVRESRARRAVKKLPQGWRLRGR